jgi:Ca-activated chloride channel family protein
MRFAAPYLLLLLIAIPLLLVLKARFMRSSAPGTFSNVALFHGYATTWRLRLRWLPTALRALALVLMIVALARPQTGRAESQQQGEGIDIALVLDTSTSMGGSFGQQSKLEAAQNVIKQFIQGRTNDRIGLVIFRENSLVLSPLTLDYDALTHTVDQVDQVNLTDGTAIGSGLADGLNLLRDSRARSRVAILLTDGENNAGTIQPLEAARLAETLGIHVYTIGAIDPQASGGSASNVDETALTEMARVTGGRYFAADNEGALEAIYQNIDQLEKSRVGRSQFIEYNEAASYFLVAALALLALELVLRSTLWRQAA